MALKVCADSGCHELTATTRCVAHTRQRDAARGRRQARGYDAAYDAQHRAYQRRMDAGETFVCWRCLEEQGIEHHVDPRPGRWHLGHDDHDRTILRGPECPAGNLATASRHTPGRGLPPRGMA